MRTILSIFLSCCIFGITGIQAQVNSTETALNSTREKTYTLAVEMSSVPDHLPLFDVACIGVKTYAVDDEKYTVVKSRKLHCPNGGGICQHGHAPIRTTTFACNKLGSLFTGTHNFYVTPDLKEDSKKPIDLLMKQLVADTNFFNFRK
jgi:hypothetical protein